jgi:hypothetical protein
MTNSPALDATEKLGADGATGPRISLRRIKDNIAEVIYTSPGAGLHVKDLRRLPQLETMTLCVVVLKSGFIVIGKSAPMSPTNYSAEKGRTFAYEDAVRQLWPMFAFHELQIDQEEAHRQEVEANR